MYLRLLITFAGCLLVLCASGCIKQVGIEPPPSHVVYYHLLLIYPSINVQYTNNGETRHFSGTMDQSLKSTIVRAFQNLPNLIMDGTNTLVLSEYDVIEISSPVTRLSRLGNGLYWLSPDDIKADLEQYAPPGKYDSVHVVWHNGPIDSYFGLGGIFINEGSTTYSSLIGGEEYFWTGLGEAFGEPFLHEWLHGVCNFYQSLGFAMPEGGPDGAELHGYSKSSFEGWMPYYRDLMRGEVWEPSLGRYTGITPEAWLSGTPRQRARQ